MSVAFVGIPVENVSVPCFAFEGALFFAHDAKDRMIGDCDDFGRQATFGAGFCEGVGGSFQCGKPGFQSGNPTGEGAHVFPYGDLIEEFQNV